MGNNYLPVFFLMDVPEDFSYACNDCEAIYPGSTWGDFDGECPECGGTDARLQWSGKHPSQYWVAKLNGPLRFREDRSEEPVVLLDEIANLEAEEDALHED